MGNTNEGESNNGYQQAGVDDSSSPNPSSYSGGASGGSSSSSAADRASALEARLQSRRPKAKDTAAIKDAHWKRYNELDKTVDPLASSAPPQIVDGVMRRPNQNGNDGATIASMPSSSSSSSSSNRALPSTHPTLASAVSAPSSSLNPNINRSRATPSAEQLMSGPKRYETAEEEYIRAQRAAVFAQPSKDKAAKAQTGKDERWRAHQELEAAANAATARRQAASAAPAAAPTTPTYSAASASSISSSSLSSSSSTPHQHDIAEVPSHILRQQSAPSSTSPSSSPPAPRSSGDAYFDQQMAYLLSAVRAMPISSVHLLRKILINLMRSGSMPPADGAKFRKIKLSGAKMQSEIVKVGGAVELLLAVGFVQRELAAADNTIDMYMIFENASLNIASLAVAEIESYLLTTPGGVPT